MTHIAPFYQDGGITIYQADSLTHPQLWADHNAHVLVTDPPYGIMFHSNKRAKHDSYDVIHGDHNVDARDRMLDLWGDRPALVFGSWRSPRPPCANVIAWVKGSSPGMGDVKSPWGSAWEEIYVIGTGFVGSRTPNWINIPTIASGARDRPDHPTPKPVGLMEQLLRRCPEDWVIVDPFCGSGATLRAAKNLGRRAIGVEIEEKYCRIAADRLMQESLVMDI